LTKFDKLHNSHSPNLLFTSFNFRSGYTSGTRQLHSFHVRKSYQQTHGTRAMAPARTLSNLKLTDFQILSLLDFAINLQWIS